MAQRGDGPDGPGSKNRDRSEIPSKDNVTDFRRELTYRLEKSGIDPDKVYGRAHDDHGHSEWIRLRITPETHDKLMLLVGPRSPVGYRSISAAMRDALIHRFAYLLPRLDDEVRASIENWLIDEQFKDAVAVEQNARRWVQEVRDQIDSIVFDYSERGQLPIAMEKLRHWLGRLPGYEEAHHVYIQQYILAKMAEVRKAILDQRGNSSHS